MRNSGFAMILALVFMIVLAVMVMAMAYFIATETRGIGFQLDDTKALYLAQAGVERALREIRDDFLTTTQIGTADSRGADTTGSVSITNEARIRYIDDSNATIDNNGDIALLRTFDSNYTNTRIISVFLFARARRTSGGTNPTLAVSYTTDGSTFTPAITQVLTSTTVTNFSTDITGSLTWSTIMNSDNFILRAQRTAGTAKVEIDALWLRVTYDIDTNTEPWFSGSYDTFPKTLGDGTIQSVSIADEAGKVHLNTASQSLLRYIMQERGIPSVTANKLASDIVDYRASNWFDSIEEIRQISDMTTAYYDLIKDYITVYSFINTNATRPPGARAPININTAPREVLEAVFDGLVLGATDPASLATDIINTRATTPFTSFYSSDTTITSDFYGFVNTRAYLSAVERNRVLDNADASFLPPVSGAPPISAETTEFCYNTDAFKVESVGKIGDINLRVKNILKDDGSHTLSTYVGDTTLTGYWKESYE